MARCGLIFGVHGANRLQGDLDPFSPKTSPNISPEGTKTEAWEDSGSPPGGVWRSLGRPAQRPGVGRDPGKEF